MKKLGLREGPAAWITAAAGVAGVIIAIVTTGVFSRGDQRPSLDDATRTTTTVPSSLPEDVPLKAGPVVVPGGLDGVRCRTVSGGPSPGLYCLVTYIIRGNDPRMHWVVAEKAYDINGPWTVDVRDRMRDGNESPDNLLEATLNLRAPSRIYIRGFATFDDAEPFLPRSAPTGSVLIDLKADGSLSCANPHTVHNSDGNATFLCAFSGDAKFSD